MTKRVLLYVQHLLGVGHVKRAAAITQGLVASGLDVTVAFGGLPVPNVNFAGATIAQLPPARSADASFSAIVDENDAPVTETWWQARERQLLDLEAQTKPDLILVEHFPFGRRKFRRELIPLFEQAKTSGNCLIVGSVRDILIEPSDVAKRDKIVSLARAWFDGILVHADPSVIRLEDTFPAARKISQLLKYTGYIVEQSSDPHTAPKGDNGTDGHDEVIVSAGGGAVGEHLFRTALEARLNGCLPQKTWRFLAGGNLDAATVRDLTAKAPPGVIMEPARPDFPALLKNAALSISQAGYNTIMDLLVARCPAIVVPFATGGETEQTARAEKFAAADLLTHVPERDLTVNTLTDAANRTVSGGNRIKTIDIDINGIQATGRIVADMVA